MKICEKCGKIVEITKDTTSELYCCNELMKDLKPNSVDAVIEKHKPVFEINGNKIDVKVAEIAHPMIEKHYIEWISIKTNYGVYKKYLKPNDAPAASFLLSEKEKVESILAYCNLHGLWETKVI